MQALWYLGLFCGVSEAILVSGSGSVGEARSAVYNNTNTADNVVSQASNHRSATYGGYYPDDLEGSIDHHGYGYEHSYYPHHDAHDHYDHHEPHYHHVEPHHHHDIGINTLLIPLVGVALLGAAAVFASNPILLQLGVVSGKRRRRGVERLGLTDQRLKDILLLEKFMGQLPKEEVERQERRLLASYLTCSGANSSICVERLACELHTSGAPVTEAERHIMDMIISEIINNEFINEGMKKNIIGARRVGHFRGDCSVFPCPELDERTKVVTE